MISMTCSKHVEKYKLINTLKRICASSWTIAKYHCMMHGQQNVKFMQSVLNILFG